jgi:hypothetical protein
MVTSLIRFAASFVVHVAKGLLKSLCFLSSTNRHLYNVISSSMSEAYDGPQTLKVGGKEKGGNHVTLHAK